MGGLRGARDADIGRLWPAVRASRLFSSREGFEQFHAQEPWRVVVDETGRAAVLERWRDHLDILGIKGVWCTQRDTGGVLAELRALAREHGYRHLLSPLIAEDTAEAYRAAGMEETERIVVLRSSLRAPRPGPSAPARGIMLDACTRADLADVVAVDDACFEEFWRHGERVLEQSLYVGRTVAVRESGQVIGYTWCTIDRGIGTLGRIAVAPQARCRGVGRVLLDDVLTHMARERVGVLSLCTQEHNTASRALYASVGLRELPGRLVLMMQDV